MQKRFRRGDLVVLSEAGRENEGYADFADKTLRVKHAATKYMPAKEFFASGKPKGYHPGFDDCGAALYDLETETGSPVNYSLYDWELESA